MPSSLGRCIPLAVAVTLLGAAPAQASVFDLSADPRAQKPDVTVDVSGAAHVAWNVGSAAGDADALVYCRVPRGAASCDISRTFQLPLDGRQPHVLLSRSGEIVVLQPRCCFPGERVYAVRSSDSGVTFGEPTVISERFYGVGQEAEFGPGDFSVSLAGGFGGGNEGLIYQSAPLDATTSQSADLTNDDWTKAFHPSVGFPDPVTPLVAYAGGPTGTPNQVYFRRWAGSGPYNDAATWGPEAHVVAGNEPKLASGLRGVFLMYEHPDSPRQYHVRRYDGAGFPELSDRTVSDAATGNPAIFRDFLQDAGGNLHAVFRQRGRDSQWRLRHTASPDGGDTWDPGATLAEAAVADDLFNLRVGAAADGGGAVVGDRNGKGPIWFAPFAAPSDRGGEACPPTVTLGKTVVRALEGCFRRTGKTWRATGPVKVNGVDIESASGGATAAAAAFRVVAKPGDRTLTTNQKALVRVGDVRLDEGPVAWKLPAGDGKVVRLESPDGSVFPDLGKYTKKLFELPVDGDAELILAKGGAQVPTHLRMPDLLGGVTGNTTLRTDQAGLVLGGMKINVPNAAVGLLRLAGIDVTYDGEDRFTGTARVALPPQYSKEITEVQFGLEDGELSLVKVTPPAFTPTLPIIGSPPTPILGLDRVAFSYVRAPGSRRFQGDIFLIGGPKFPPGAIAELDGAVTLEFPASKPTTLSATGKLKLVKIPFASGSATYTVGFPGAFDFSGGFDLGPLSGSVSGFVDLGKGKFSASGSATTGINQGTVVISSKGFAACISIPLAPDFGMTWKWSDPLPSTPLCPDVQSFKVSPSRVRAAQAAANLPGGLREAAIVVEGSGGAPAVTVTAPNGETVTTGADVVESGRFRATPAHQESRTYVQIDEPPAGAYRIDAQVGSVPITRVLTSGALPDPRVSTTVRGKGRTRSLSYRVRGVDGQRVTFAEESDGVYREIAAARGERGTVRFRSADGPGGPRRIVAIVDQDDVPRARLIVGRYTAPAPARLRPPRRVIPRRRGTRLDIRWNPVAGARSYEVKVTLPRDGRRLLFVTPRNMRRVTVGNVEPSDNVTVLVAAVGGNARPGASAKITVKPSKQRRIRRR